MNWNAKYVQVSPYEKMAQEKKGKEILSTHASGPEKSSMPSLIQRMLHNLGIGRSQQNPLRQCTSDSQSLDMLLADPGLSAESLLSLDYGDRLGPQQKSGEDKSCSHLSQPDLWRPEQSKPVWYPHRSTSQLNMDSPQHTTLQHQYSHHRASADGAAQLSMPKSMSLPIKHTSPDPFPELSNSPATPSPVLRSRVNHNHRLSPAVSPAISRGSSPVSQRTHSKDSLHIDDDEDWTPTAYTKLLLNFYTEDNLYSLTVEESKKAHEICNEITLLRLASADRNWVIVEQLGGGELERNLEDHELVSQVYKGWTSSAENRFHIRRDLRKYEFFTDPTQFFPSNMFSLSSDSEKACIIDKKTDRQTSLLLQNLFTTNCAIPDIHGYMHMKEKRKSWKKCMFLLRPSGLYYSNKGSSKEPRHLTLFAQLKDFNIYQVQNAKKLVCSPNQSCLCLKAEDGSGGGIRESKLLCAEDEPSKLCWLTAMRLLKYGSQLRDNYKDAVRRESKHRHKEDIAQPPHRDGQPQVKSRVAMDFTGDSGRVVDDPNEALGVAREEEKEWRKKTSGVPPSRFPASQPPPGRASPTPVPCSLLSDNPDKDMGGLSAGLHMAQPWFFSGINRLEAVELMLAQGLVDGLFLVRESHSSPGSYVLSMAHKQKVMHCQIRQIEMDGVVYFSLDGGHTKFLDLTQLVEFYQLNAKGLPTNLTHYMIRM